MNTGNCKTNWWNIPSAAISSRVAAVSASCAMPCRGRGKSGGVRVIYYWVKDSHLIYMLVVYPKSKKDDLTDKETTILREFVKEL